MKRLTGLAIALALVAAACAVDASAATSTSDGVVSGIGMGPGISVEDAIANSSEQPLLVNGFLFVGTDGSVVLASLMAESMPPQAGGAQLTVVGLDVNAYQFSESQSLRWTDQQVQVLGIIDGDILSVSTTLSG